MTRGRLRAALVVAGCLAAAACLPRERINASCRWTDGAAPALPPPGDPARRAHLLEDVRVAQDLGILYVDSAQGRLRRAAWGDAQVRCTERALGEIVRRHGVSRAEVVALRGARELWIDVVLVFVPVFAPFLLVSRVAVRRLVARYAPGERGPAAAVLAIWTPVAGAVALGLTQCWGMSVEDWRSRTDHVSYRAFQLPASRHAWLVWGAATALFAGVAVHALLRRRVDARAPRHDPPMRSTFTG